MPHGRSQSRTCRSYHQRNDCLFLTQFVRLEPIEWMRFNPLASCSNCRMLGAKQGYALYFNAMA